MQSLELLDASLSARLAEEEDLDESLLRQAIGSGRMVLLHNPAHAGGRPVLIGQPASIKVNANIGTSPLMNDPNLEEAKAAAAERAGAHTIMDLSTAGDLDSIRSRLLLRSALPLGTVPIYGLAQKYIDKGHDPAALSDAELLEEIHHQAEQGVDFMTLHCGVTRRGAALAQNGRRIMGIVSRGGAILARWMAANQRENPLLEAFDAILRICSENHVTISLGDGLRPGAGSDAGDPAQWEEVVTLGELAERARQVGVQVMIEGPGHVPLHLIQSQIQGMKRLCGQAPLYVLGPLTTDRAAGHDHIAGAIGGALAGYYGADFLCYLTPAEHVTLPNELDVWQGVKASMIAAHSAEVALGRARAEADNDRASSARAILDWDSLADACLDPALARRRRGELGHDSDACAMCGEFCAIKLLR
jgi:phosphomethylpyrimidine synthase